MTSSTNSQTQNILITPLSNPFENGKIPNPKKLPRPIVFLSGTTNHHKDETRWQQVLTDYLFTTSSSSTSTSTDSLIACTPVISHPPLTIIDPYNPDWDSTWREDQLNDKFVTQVDFEIECLEVADVVVVGFVGRDVREGKIGVGGSSLVELGVVLGRGKGEGLEGKKVIVCVESGFWKEGYVRVLCERFGEGVSCVGSLEGLMGVLGREVGGWGLGDGDEEGRCVIMGMGGISG
ncbi:hypothetical protein SBOR_3696 [Sclerotinia borealis F-4128]|uniref:Uncharacterized protein n=1 Tax=Sclerotinia borealis (strain F-4128) TaxID=1432307 RepID=W9CIS5_SCLBF|nr:hypothetical protein SBOR_3696 [Sclerotinia borealis F-4128]